MSRTGELFPPKPRRPRRKLLAVVDGGDQDGIECHVRLECMRCGHDDGWQWLTPAELRAGIACPKCNPREVLQSYADGV